MNYDRSSLYEILKISIDAINQGVSKTLTMRRADETPPASTRHLTDTRTRVSSLLEYALSYELNLVLKKTNSGQFISNVLWNVFPDLILRDSKSINKMGIEVKALHAASEEKSANLKTPISIIRKDKDFIVILIWSWVNDTINGVDTVYPHIHNFGVFDGWLLAKIRDTTWLINDKDRIKGLDISTPIIDSDGTKFKAEEGNMGKLLRIHLSNDISTKVPYYLEMKNEALKYKVFTDGILARGINLTFENISTYLGGEFTLIHKIVSYPTAIMHIATITINKEEIICTAGGSISISGITNSFNPSKSGGKCIHLGSKLGWKIYHNNSTEWVSYSGGKKPDIEMIAIEEGLTHT
jgi:hypothetical protein